MTSSPLSIGLALVWLSAASLPAFAQAPAPPPPPGWAGSFGAGYSLAKGNSNTNTVNVSYEIKRDTGSDLLFKSTGLFLRGQSDGTVDTNRLGLDTRVDHKFSARTSIYGQLQYLHDAFKDINYLLSPTVGIGQRLVGNDRVTLAVDAGVGFVWEKNPDAPLSSSGALSAGQDVKIALTSTTALTQKIAALWKMDDLEDALYSFGAGVAAGMTNRTQMKVELIETYKNKPPTDATTKSDLAMLVSFVFKY